VNISAVMLACSDTSGLEPVLKSAGNHSQRAQAPSDPALVAAYGFDETSGPTVVDASSQNNSGTIGSGVTRTTSGRYGGALSFSGTGRVTIADAASLRLTQAMTLEAWVNPSTVNNSWRDVVYKADDNYYLMATSTNNSRPAGGASFGNTAATTEAYGTAALPTGVWTHLAVTYDGSTIRLFVNGTQVSTVAKTGSFTTSANPLQIGGNAIYGQFFQGLIDEVRVYNRPLSAGEIQTDMNTPVGTTTPPPTDTVPPTLAITAPTSSGSYTTTANSVTVSGTASDNVGVTSVQWASSRGGSGVATGTTNWSAAAIPLQAGTNILTVTARDAAGNVGTATLTVVSNVVNPATQITITTQPSASAASGSVFSQQPVLQLRDASGAAVAQSGVAITASLAIGSGTLDGTTTATTDASGSARFTNLSITGPNGVVMLRFTSGALTGATSNAINITGNSPPTSQTYTTGFFLTEFPISEGGRWLNGGTDGIDWSDVSSGSGRAIGHQVGASYTDATAILTGSWGANQSVTATVFTAGNVAVACSPEVELRLRTTVAPHSIRGYEISYIVSTSGEAYLIIVRWNAALGDFTYLLSVRGAQYGVRDGDVISASIVGNVITAYKNGVVMGQATDAAVASGNPGFGFNLENGPSGCSSTNDRYGFSHFSATDAVSP